MICLTKHPVFETLNLLNYNNEVIDPLLGCSQSLFVIMGKVANLITKSERLNIKANRRKKYFNDN